MYLDELFGKHSRIYVICYRQGTKKIHLNNFTIKRNYIIHILIIIIIEGFTLYFIKIKAISLYFDVEKAYFVLSRRGPPPFIPCLGIKTKKNECDDSWWRTCHASGKYGGTSNHRKSNCRILLPYFFSRFFTVKSR